MALASTSCIDDSGIPYPNIHANFSQFRVAHQERAAAIDTVTRNITVFLNDSADIRAVNVISYALSPDMAALVNPQVFDQPIDLSDTLTVMLKVYREYAWTITARQTLERQFTVEGQIGASVIDAAAHTVTAVIPSDQPLSAVKVTSIRLGGALSTITPDIAGTTVDFTDPVTVQVTDFGITTPWTITITQTHLNVSLSSVEAWTGVIWAEAAAAQGSDVKFEYRKSGTMQWTEVPAPDVTPDGAVYHARINGVEPQTQYDVRAVLGDEATTPLTVTTGSATQLPNDTFTQWWLNGKVWCPWAEDGTSFWDTGNKGAATLGQSNVVPTADPNGGYQGVTLQTRFVGIGPLGKLAAGSIFAGSYVRTEGTNGVLSFGRPFTERPTAVKARIRYSNVAIDYAAKGSFESLKGQPDTCVVWCALWDGDEPYEIRTNPNNRQLFNRDLPQVVAYGEFCSGDAIDEFTDVIIPLNYNSLTRVPKMIMLVSAASKYGDYFTGGNGTVMWLSSYELLYDYQAELSNYSK